MQQNPSHNTTEPKTKHSKKQGECTKYILHVVIFIY